MGTRAWQTVALKTKGAPFTNVQPHSHDEAARLATALWKASTSSRESTLEEAFQQVGISPSKMAIGAYPGGCVILNFDIANALIHPGEHARDILAVLAAPDVAAITAHSVSSFWGYAIYHEASLIRASSGGDGSWDLNHGDVLPTFEPDLVGRRVEETEDGNFLLVTKSDDDEVTDYDIGDEAANLITDHYLPSALWCEMRCTVFERRGWLSRLFGG